MLGLGALGFVWWQLSLSLIIAAQLDVYRSSKSWKRHVNVFGGIESL